MENTICKVTLGKIIWIPTHLRELSLNTQDIAQKTMAIWDMMHKREKWEYNSPLIPVRDRNNFPPGKGRLFGNWIKKDNLQLKD